jgi:hypothetical protein
VRLLQSRWCGWLPLTASGRHGADVIEASHERRSHPSWKLAPLALDLAKNVFQVHAAYAFCNVVIRKAICRSQVLPLFAMLRPYLVGTEACGGSHYWARELLALGHDVRLMPPAYVKPYVKRSKTDAAAICEAVTPNEIVIFPPRLRRYLHFPRKESGRPNRAARWGAFGGFACAG